MIYITGDTHIPVDIGKLSAKKFPEQRILTKNDYVIICGDFGGLWDGSKEEKYWLDWLNKRNFTTLFVDGNHENFDMLKTLPTEEFCGGIAHKINGSIYHLMRGRVYTIDNKKIFTFGGAESHDKKSRTEGISWWKDEMPDENECKIAYDNLKAHDNKVDYIITHSAPTSIQKQIKPQYNSNKLTDFLEEIKNNISYQTWYFGHYHKDIIVDAKHICNYYEITQIN